MEKFETLSKESLFLFSMGCDKPHTLQILRIDREENSLFLVLYDGIVCAGARCDLSLIRGREGWGFGGLERNGGQKRGKESLDGVGRGLKELDVVRVQLDPSKKIQPLRILQLEILQSNVKNFLGRKRVPLSQYLSHQSFEAGDLKEEREVEELGRPSKQVKLNEEESKKRQKAGSEQLSPHSLQGQNKTRNGSKKIVSKQHTKNAVKREERPEQSRAEDESDERMVGQQQEGRHKFSGVKVEYQGYQRDRLIYEQNLASWIREPEEGKEQKFEGPLNNSVNQPLLAALKPNLTFENKVGQPQANINRQNQKPILQRDQKVSPKPTPVDTNPKPNPSFYKKQTFHPGVTFIRDLYQRIPRFLLHCRVNHRVTAKYPDGNEQLIIMLIDEAGDEILCSLYQKLQAKDRRLTNQECAGILQVGKTYFLENGSVKKDKNGMHSLTMYLDGIRQSTAEILNFNPEKILRVGQLAEKIELLSAERERNQVSNDERKEGKKEFSVCGIFMGWKNCSTSLADRSQRQPRLIGRLCDPLRQKCINFSFFLKNYPSFPQEQGLVLTLHNMELKEQQDNYRLYSTRRAYFQVQSHNKHEYLRDLVALSANGGWRALKYSNFSEPEFVRRSVEGVRDRAAGMVVGEKLFSQIQGKLSQIAKKKDQTACKTCFKRVKPLDHLYAHCYFCKSKKKWTKRTYYTAEITQNLITLTLQFSNQEFQAVVGVPHEDFEEMKIQAKSKVLAECTTRCLLFDVKSERRVNQCRHYVRQVHRVTFEDRMGENNEEGNLQT